MPLQLKSPEVKDYPLIESDPTGETIVTIRQATMWENTQRADLWATASRIMRDSTGSELELKQRISLPEVARKEVWLTLIGCNITKEDGTDLFRFKRDGSGRVRLTMSENQFADAWGLLPPLLASEIHRSVIAQNPDWGNGVAAGEDLTS